MGRAMSRFEPERRAHKRLELACPVVAIGGDGHELFRATTCNVSDGGVLLEPVETPVPAGQSVHVNLRVPRRTANTFMYEDFFCEAAVVRRKGARAGAGAGLALKFASPLRLDLEP